MKIRTDFVTNSSSSSFVSVIVNTQSGDSYEFCGFDVAGNDEEYSFPEIVEGKLVYERWNNKTDSADTVEIKSVIKLMEVLFEFSGIDKNEVNKEKLETITGLEFKDIKCIIMEQDDSSWEGDFEGEDDMLDDDGIFTSGVSYEIDMSELF